MGKLQAILLDMMRYLICIRLPNIQMDDWIANTNYTGEFENRPNHQVVLWFWEVIE